MVTDHTGSKTMLDDQYLMVAHATIETVQTARCDVELSTNLRCECPYDDITDEYNLTVSYRPQNDRCLELASFKEFLGELEGAEASQEALCQFLTHVLYHFLHPEWVEVELDGEHYGIEVTASERWENGE